MLPIISFHPCMKPSPTPYTYLLQHHSSRMEPLPFMDILVGRLVFSTLAPIGPTLWCLVDLRLYGYLHHSLKWMVPHFSPGLLSVFYVACGIGSCLIIFFFPTEYWSTSFAIWCGGNFRLQSFASFFFFFSSKRLVPVFQHPSTPV